MAGMILLVSKTTKLADMDARIAGFKAALSVQFITLEGLTVEGVTVIDVVPGVADGGTSGHGSAAATAGGASRSPTWKIVMRDVEEGVFVVKAPAASADGRPMKVNNPFCNKTIAGRMMFWWKHAVCWAQVFIGGTDRKCNASSEIVNHIIKNNSFGGVKEGRIDDYAIKRKDDYKGTVRQYAVLSEAAKSEAKIQEGAFKVAAVVRGERYVPSSAVLEEGWAKRTVILEPVVEVVRAKFQDAKLKSTLKWDIVVEQVNALMTPEQLDQHKLGKGVAAQFAAGTYKLKQRDHKIQLSYMEKWANESRDGWETVTKKEGGEVGEAVEAASSHLKGAPAQLLS